MQIEIKSLHRDLGTTIIYVTHDQDEALSMSNRVAVRHRGRLEQCAAPQEMYAAPASKFVAGFIGEANFFPATVDRQTGAFAQLDGLPVRVPLRAGGSLQAGSRVSVCARPEHLRLSAAAAGVEQSHPEETLFLGDPIKGSLRLRDTRILIKVPVAQGQSIPAVGSTIGFELDAAACTVFPEAG